MDKRIIYQLPGQPVTILIPCQCGLTLEQIGHKDVPPSVPFWIIDSDKLPAERTFRDAWELDVESMGDPSGIGGAE